jgi:hypothetical protein
MAKSVTVVPDTRMLISPDWQLRAERVNDSDTGWYALVGIRRGLKLLVAEDAGWLMVEAWTGEPEDSDAAAVIDVGDGALRVATVPLCSCGVRECGNAGVQFGKLIAPRDLPALVETLRELPGTDIIPTRSNVLRGTELVALDPPDPDPDRRTGRSYAYSPLTRQRHGYGPGHEG